MVISIEESPVQADDLSELLSLIENETISGKIAKDVLDLMLETNKKASEIVEERGLKQNTNTDDIIKLIDEVIVSNPKQVEQYKSGNDRIFGFFVGQLMKLSGGKINPKMANDLLKDKLSN